MREFILDSLNSLRELLPGAVVMVLLLGSIVLCGLCANPPVTKEEREEERRKLDECAAITRLDVWDGSLPYARMEEGTILVSRTMRGDVHVATVSLVDIGCGCSVLLHMIYPEQTSGPYWISCKTGIGYEWYGAQQVTQSWRRPSAEEMKLLALEHEYRTRHMR